jgi:uncharacterized RDD family membrane protein YckC
MTSAHIKTGVYFAKKDYAGLGRRLLILLIDAAVILAAWTIPALIVNALAIPVSLEIFAWTWFLAAVAYLTILEASSIGSVGFLVCGVRIVTLRGERPSVARMGARLAICTIGPFSLPVDLIWLAGDDRRQSLRDRIAGTYVVRKSAEPAGRGPIRAATLMFLGMTLSYWEVQRGDQTLAPVEAPA